MKLRLALAAIAVLSTAAVSAPPASAAPIISLRVCQTTESWAWAPALSTATYLGGTAATENYTYACNFIVGVQPTPPFIVTSTSAGVGGPLHFTYIGNCVLSLYTFTGDALPTGLFVGGIVGVFFGSNGTTNNVSVKVLDPTTFTRGICDESAATGQGVGVGTF